MWSRYLLSCAMQHGWFVLGVCLGVSGVLLALPDEPPQCTAGQVHAAGSGVAPALSLGSAAPRGGSAGAGAAPVRPRYYHTELGVRGAMLGAVLAAGAGLAAGSRAAAINVTSRLPDLKLFVLASRLQPPGAAGVVAFTDTREMLKPFHALKYLADNHLDEYNYFFLTEDSSYIDGVKLLELVKKLSVGQDVYMGIKDDNDSHYCLLESGIVISNSVLRLVHSSLDWCVRNSYSPHHHENVGRCILHAAHTPCTDTLQGVQFPRRRESRRAPALSPADEIHALHAHVSWESLREARMQMSIAAATAAISAGKSKAKSSEAEPSGAKSIGAGTSGAEWGSSWPPGMRRYPTTSANRFEYVRWRHFNLTHGFLWEDKSAVAPLSQHYRNAIQAVFEEVKQWLSSRDGSAEQVQLTGGALRFMPQAGLYYRLFLSTADSQHRVIEAVRPLGSARLVSAPYVTESARLVVLLTLSASPSEAERDSLRHLVSHCAGNKTSVVVLSNSMSLTSVWPGGPPACVSLRVSLRSALAGLRSHTVLLLTPHHTLQEDALNRVRMNCLSGVQWYLPSPWARGVALGSGGARGGKFRLTAAPTVLAAIANDVLQALTQHPPPTGLSEIEQVAYSLSRSPLACLHAPEPAILYTPPLEPPCVIAQGDKTKQMGINEGRMGINERRLGINEGHSGTNDGHLGPDSKIAILNYNNIDVNEKYDFKDIINDSVYKNGISSNSGSSQYKMDTGCLRKLRNEKFKTLELGSRQSLATLLLQSGVDL